MASNLQNSLFLLLSAFTAALACELPDVPVGGTYKTMPLGYVYIPGDVIRYSCHLPSLLIGAEERICQSDGKWTNTTPFCDLPAKFKKPSETTYLTFPADSEKAIDEDTESCFSTEKTTSRNITDSFWAVLDKPAAVYLVRLLVPKGPISASIILHSHGIELPRVCSRVLRRIEEKQWILVSCKQNSSDPYPAVWIEVKDRIRAPNTLQICEIQVYTKGKIWCEDPPDVFIENGFLLVSRDKATLQCEEGYNTGPNTRLVCGLDGKWSRSQMRCDEILCDSSQIDDVAGGEWKIVNKPLKLSIGTKKKLACHEGYKMVGNGSDTIECLSTGLWSHSSATCEKLSDFLPEPPDFEISHKDVMIECIPPHYPEFGGYGPVQDVYMPGDSIYYFCDVDTYISGDNYRQCLDTGDWTGDTPVCDLPVVFQHMQQTSTAEPEYKYEAERASDGSKSSCSSTKLGERSEWTATLQDVTQVIRVMLFLPKGRAAYEVFAVRPDGTELSCGGPQNANIVLRPKATHWVIRDGTAGLTWPPNHETFTAKEENLWYIQASGGFEHPPSSYAVVARTTVAKKARAQYHDWRTRQPLDYIRYEWIFHNCSGPNNVGMSSITIKSRSSSIPLRLCEVVVHVITGPACVDPHISIENGRLMLNRKKATLVCDRGFTKSRDSSLECIRTGEWTRKVLYCIETDREVESIPGTPVRDQKERPTMTEQS